MESGFLEPSISQTSRFLEQIFVSLGRSRNRDSIVILLGCEVSLSELMISHNAALCGEHSKSVSEKEKEKKERKNNKKDGCGGAFFIVLLNRAFPVLIEAMKQPCERRL